MKGFDQFHTTEYEEGAEVILAAALCQPLDVDTVLGGPGRERLADDHAGVRRRPRLRRPLS